MILPGNPPACIRLIPGSSARNIAAFFRDSRRHWAAYFPSGRSDRVDFEDAGILGGSDHGPDQVETSHGKKVSRRRICDLLGRDRAEMICVSPIDEWIVSKAYKHDVKYKLPGESHSLLREAHASVGIVSTRRRVACSCRACSELCSNDATASFIGGRSWRGRGKGKILAEGSRSDSLA